MKQNSLLLTLILLLAGAGLVSAQTAQKTTWYVVDGLFFEGMPPAMDYGKAARIYVHQDEAGHKAIELQLRAGVTLPADVKAYATPSDSVAGYEALQMSIRGGEGERVPMYAQRTLKSEEWIGKPFPEFCVKDTTGREWTRADIEGRPLMLNFWYTGCGPCLREMPVLATWTVKYPQALYLATTFDPLRSISRIVQKRGFTFVHVADELFFFKLFNVSGMPVTILTDRKGIIRCVEEGTSPVKLRYLEDKLAEFCR